MLTLEKSKRDVSHDAPSSQPATSTPPSGRRTLPLTAPAGSPTSAQLLTLGDPSTQPATDPPQPVFADPPLDNSPYPLPTLAHQTHSLLELPQDLGEELLPPGHKVQPGANPVVGHLLGETQPKADFNALPALSTRDDVTQTIATAAQQSASANGGKPQLIIGETHYSLPEAATTEAVIQMCLKYGIKTVCVETSPEIYRQARDWLPLLTQALGVTPNSLNSVEGRRAAFQLALRKKALDPPFLNGRLNHILRIKAFEANGLQVKHIDHHGEDHDDTTREAEMASAIVRQRQAEDAGTVVICGAIHVPRVQRLASTGTHPPPHSVLLLADELQRDPSKFGAPFDGTVFADEAHRVAAYLQSQIAHYQVPAQLLRVSRNFQT